MREGSNSHTQGEEEQDGGRRRNAHERGGRGQRKHTNVRGTRLETILL